MARLRRPSQPLALHKIDMEFGRSFFILYSYIFPKSAISFNSILRVVHDADENKEFRSFKLFTFRWFDIKNLATPPTTSDFVRIHNIINFPCDKIIIRHVSCFMEFWHFYYLTVITNKELISFMQLEFRNWKVRHFDNFVQRKFAILIIRGIFGRLSKWRTFWWFIRHFDNVLENFDVTGKKVRHFDNDPIGCFWTVKE